MEKEERFRQQAPHYLPCFINDCPHHESCLHWLTGQYGEETDDTTIICVNPHNRKVKTGNCCYYRENKVVTEDMQLIADICKEGGWTGEIRYDGFEEDYLW